MTPPVPVRLVLVHGSRLSHTQWWPQVSRIRADPACAGWLEVVTPDLPGHGARASEPFTLDRAVGAVAAAVEGAVEAVADSPNGYAGNTGYVASGFPDATHPVSAPGRPLPDASHPMGEPAREDPDATHPMGEPAREDPDATDPMGERGSGRRGAGVRVVLVGHSLGGYVAAAYAATFPRRLDGLVLLGCAAVPRGPGASAYRAVGLLTERAGEPRMARVNDRVLGRLYPPELVAEVTAGGYWFGPTRAAWHEVMTRCGPHQLREVTCPVLVAGGAYDQLMVDARRYARAAPRGWVRVLPRAGHLAGFDQPQAVTDLLTDVARSVADGTLGPP